MFIRTFSCKYRFLLVGCCFLRFYVIYFTDFNHHFHVPLLTALKPSQDFAASSVLQRQIVEWHNNPILWSKFPLSFQKPRLVWPGRFLLQSLQLFQNGSVALKPEWARWKAFMAAGKLITVVGMANDNILECLHRGNLNEI